MPIEVTLLVPYGDPWPSLRRCPSIARALEGGSPPDSLDVTALALEQDIYGRSYELPADDEAFLGGVASGLVAGDPVLLPSDLHDDKAGRAPASLLGELRVRFLGWVAAVARERDASINVTYHHERGDWPYEIARWTLGAHQHLVVACYDGGAEPLWQASIERPSAAPAAPRPHGFFPFERLLRDRKP